MVYSAKSDDIGTISQFTRLKYIHITTNGSSTPVNYQVKLTIDYEPEMQADFSDIRFNTLGNIYIDYWIESKTDSVTATVWVELPDAITDPGSDTMWMCYGNAGLSDGGDGVDTFNVFDIFDNLNGWALAGSPTLSTTQVYKGTNSCLINADQEYMTRTPVGVGIYSIMYYDTGDTTMEQILQHAVKVSSVTKSVMFGYASPHNANYYIYRYDTTYYSSGIARSVGWHEFKIIMTGSEQKLYIDDVLIDTRSYDSGTENDNILVVGDSWAGGIIGNGYWDLYLVRKYIANEPTPSYGTAQHQRRVPQFIN